MSNFPDGMSPNEIPGEREDAKNAYVQRYVDSHCDDVAMVSLWFHEVAGRSLTMTTFFVKFMMEFDDVMDSYVDWLEDRAEDLFEAGEPCPE